VKVLKRVEGAKSEDADEGEGAVKVKMLMKLKS
jgi:hypothetical protein